MPPGLGDGCPNQELIGYQYDGGFAELMRVPAKVLAVDGVNRIPAGLSFAEASVAEPLSCVINGQERARVGEGQTVVVVGAGRSAACTSGWPGSAARPGCS